jgi:hypothetical protein
MHTVHWTNLSLIPFLASNGDTQLTEVDWGRGLDDVPHTSKLRVLTGMVLLAADIHCDYLQNQDSIFNCCWQ